MEAKVLQMLFAPRHMNISGNDTSAILGDAGGKSKKKGLIYG